MQELQAVQLELEGLCAALVARAQLLAVRVRPRQRGCQVPRLDLPQPDTVMESCWASWLEGKPKSMQGLHFLTQ